jgi:hypothetical protein
MREEFMGVIIIFNANMPRRRGYFGIAWILKCALNIGME